MEIEKRLLELQLVQELQLRLCFVRNIDLDILLQDIRTFRASLGVQKPEEI
jgi:hypothetical protein